MAYKNLQEFIALLEKRGHLKRIKSPVSAELEITEITDRVCKGPLEKNVALLFENVAGHDTPVLINSLGHHYPTKLRLKPTSFNARVQRRKREILKVIL